MARAKRHYIPGHVWHITHRCHKREFLLKFPRDRRKWIEWLYQAKKRYSGLSVLDYMVTSNHVHLDFDRLMELLGFGNYGELRDAHCKWADSVLQTDSSGKEDKWTQSIAVGSESFVERMKKALGYRARGRKMIRADDTSELREAQAPYGGESDLDAGNTFFWGQPSTGPGSIDHHP